MTDLESLALAKKLLPSYELDILVTRAGRGRGQPTYIVQVRKMRTKRWKPIDRKPPYKQIDKESPR